ncbi:hypothetical protein HA466_0251240 [Hirschfeldia incana]|nr:hypothetical protein HA466_0251240 [Hirschfeldia incana]
MSSDCCHKGFAFFGGAHDVKKGDEPMGVDMVSIEEKVGCCFTGRSHGQLCSVSICTNWRYALVQLEGLSPYRFCKSHHTSQCNVC